MKAAAEPLAQPLRIAVAGDWHANAGWAERTITCAKDRCADVIVHLGDFGYEFTPGFLRRVSTALAHAQLSLLFVDGNHESFDRLNRYPIRASGLREIAQGIYHLPRGFRWTWGGVRFLALGGAHSVDRPYRVPGVSWWPQELITPEQAADAIAGGPTDVLVAHDCPAGVDIPGLEDTAHLFPPLEILRADEHRQTLRTVVNAVRPREIWHGHYHRHYQTTTDLGYGAVRVTGLDCDETHLGRNVQIIALDDLRGAL